MVAALPSARAEHTAVTLPDDRIFVYGGSLNDNPDTSGLAWTYDPATDAWTAAAAGDSRRLHSATLGGDGKAYAIGGRNQQLTQLADVDRYNPATNGWEAVTNFPVTMDNFAATTDDQGRVYAVEGNSNGGRVWRYDPATGGGWAQLDVGLWSYRYGVTAAFADGRVYVIGGASSSNDSYEQLDVYDVVADTWSQGTPLTVGRVFAEAAAEGGTVYVAGGRETLNGPVCDDVLGYDIATGTWSSRYTLATPRYEAATVISGGYLYVIGGWNAAGQPLASVERFTLNRPPNAPTWTTPDDQAVAADEANTLTWAFNDPDPGDTQSAYNLKRWTLDANGSRVGAPVATYAATPLSQHTIPAGTLTAGTKYELQVDTFDSRGVEGPYSASLFLTAGTRPSAPTWLDPTNGQSIGLSSYTGTISAPNVDASEWTLYADNAGSIDTATILQGPVTKTTGDLRSHTWTGLANNTTVWWSVRIKDGGLWSQPAQIRTPISYTPPPAPTYVKSDDPANGRLLVAITNPAPAAGEPSVAYNNVHLDDGDGRGERLQATMLPTNTTWPYNLPRSGKQYDGSDGSSIRVEAVATNGTTSTSN